VRIRNLLARIAGRAVERPTPVIVGAVLLALIGAVAALGLEADRSPNSLVDKGSSTYSQTQDFYKHFGDEPVEVLVKGDLRQLLLTTNVGKLLALESCLSGKSNGGQVIQGQPAPAPCAAIARLNPSAVVFGPATFLNQFAIEANDLYQRQAQETAVQAQRAGQRAAATAAKRGYSKAQQQQAATAASAEITQRFQRQIVTLGVRYGQQGLPSLTNKTFVESVICNPGLPGCTPKSRLAAIAPSQNAALISVRLRPGLSDAERSQAISLFRQATEDPAFHLKKFSLGPTQPSYVVSGVPVVFEGLAQELSTQIFILLAAALAAMVIALALVFRAPLRLLPLGIALGAAGITFGFLSLIGGSLTMASIAVLPVLIGLSVDYAIQFQARFVEAVREGSSPPRAAVEAAARGGPVIATAGLATAGGFLVLVLSPIPMVRGFALLLVGGIAVAFVLALTAGLSALSLLGRPGGAARPGRLAGPRERMRAALRPASELGSRIGAGAGRLGRRALAISISAPGRVLAVAAVLAAIGWGAGTQIPVISDIRQLVPANLPALQDVDQLESATGISGLTYVTVTAPDLTDPKVISWMHGFEQRVLERHGYTGSSPSCQAARPHRTPE
jgi:predicted RND superfamily exporter protein